MPRISRSIRTKAGWFLLAELLFVGGALRGGSQIIIPQYPPGVYVIGTNLIWSMTNGPRALTIYVVASANLTLTMTNWSRLSTNTFDQNGKLVLILPIEPDKPRRFYRLAIPIP
jgi:hypothetical protein